MKIISLHFKNLNSLKGEFKIDFTTPALANAGLFAITGPTGAGKSTILDAITLALYSYTPRLEDINDATISDKGVIVTKNTRDAFSHLEFEVNGQKYKSEWAITKNRNDNWNKVTHKLSIYDEDKFVALKDKVSETKAEVTKITRLTKDQFTKAIVLSQGKFDEFLKSGKDDRYKLLEIITGTDIYRKIGQKVFKALSLLNEEVKVLEAQMKGIDRLTKEDVELFELKKVNLGNEANELKAALVKLNQLKLTKENIDNLVKQKASIVTDWEILQEKEKEFKPFLTKLDEHEKALPLQVDFNDWVKASEAVKKHTAELHDLNNRLNELQQQKEGLFSELSLISNLAVEESNFILQLENFVKTVTSVDEDIIKVNAALEQKKVGLKTLFAQIPSSIHDTIKPIAKSDAQLNELIKTNDEKLNVNPLPAGFDVTRIGEEIELLNDKSLLLKEVIGHKADLEKLISLKTTQESNLSSLQILVKDYEKDFAELSSLKLKQEKDLQVVQIAYDANLAYMSLDLHRNNLIEGEACPCCGSLEHPYVNTQKKVDNEMEEQLKKMKQNLNETESKTVEIREALVSYTSKIESLKESLDDTGSNIVIKTGLCTDVLNKLQLLSDTTSITLVTLVNDNAKNIENLKAHKLWNETKQPLLTYVGSLEKYIEDESRLDLLTNKRKSLYSGNSISDFKNIQVVNWNNNEKDIKNTNDAILTTTENKVQQQDAYMTLNNKLTKNVKELAFESIEHLKLVLLSDEILDKYKKQKAALLNERVTLASKEVEAEKQYQIETNKDDESIVYNDLVELINEKSLIRDTKNNEIGSITTKLSANEENQSKFDDFDSRLQTVKINQGYYKTLSELIGDKDGDKFNNIIQRITLRLLFQMTNERLCTIMDRYQVDLGTEKDEDEIIVIDTYMGDERRVIDSVSGGERFVISLAMALSLSDLASNNVKLESVFIDEGFGSLSPEELDNAISMLERMQVENEKTIGIISHVESLKERITTQIVVKKVQNGESKIYLKHLDGEVSLEVA